MDKTVQKKDNEEEFECWEKDKNSVVLDDSNMQLMRNLKEDIKSEFDINLTYNNIMRKIFESIDPKVFSIRITDLRSLEDKDFEEKVKILREQMKGGNKAK